MQIAFHSVGQPNTPILDLIPRVAAAGYGGIELNAETLPWANPHVTPETSTGDREAIRRACAAHSLAIPAVGAHIEMLSADPAVRAVAIRFVEGCIDLAADLGSPLVHVLSGPQPSDVAYEDGWRWFADAVARTTTYAGGKGIGLGVEAIAGHLFHRTDDYHRLYRDLPGTPFFVMYDPSHYEVQGESPIRVADELGDHIRHVHLKDGKGRFPDFAFPPLGQGTIDLRDVVRHLHAVGYAGAVSVEYEAQAFGYHLEDDTILRTGRTFCEEIGVTKETTR